MNADIKELEEYVKKHSTPQDELLSELERKTNLYTTQPRMLSGQIQGKLLEYICLMFQPKRVLEIGTFTGYSAICMARGLGNNCHIDTVDINDEIAHIPNQFFEKSGEGRKISQHLGSVIDLLPTLGGSYDLIFIDGDKREYPQYFNLIMDGGYVHSGSIMLADNTLWDGKVVDLSPKNLKDNYTQGILKFNQMVAADPRVEVVMLPFRDGMSIIRVK